MGYDDEAIEVSVDSPVAETDAAYGFEIDGELVWLPKSQVIYDEATGTVSVPEWLAIKKGLA